MQQKKKALVTSHPVNEVENIYDGAFVFDV